MRTAPPAPAASPAPLAIWAGVECTVNRVGARWHDQLERSGHAQRADDVERLADLGVPVVRYPLLWERVAPANPDAADWGWVDERLERLRARGVAPIAGLVHHGSGPRGTHLLDPALPDKLAAYARAVAERAPWVRAWTPINEPLTTARFSCLYGHWFPHALDDGAFARSLVLECRAIAAAMRAIRAVIPGAALVQTEDVAPVRGTPALAEQLAFENHRRWLTFDLLAGRVDRTHPLARWLLDHAVPAAWLDELVREPCPADVVGVNYYVTSERWLDDRLHLYPVRLHGGNGRQAYADVEAVRVAPEGLLGARSLLEEAWRRYRRPVALTEVHIGCHREDQLRWLRDAWLDAEAARAGGAEVLAITAWAAFGSFDWHCLVTRAEGRYEPGLFDVRGPAPRPTALARLVRAVAASGRIPDDPALAGEGWWRRAQRWLVPAAAAAKAA